MSSTNIVHLLWITWLIIILLDISTSCLEAFNTLFLLLLLLKFLISYIKFLLLGLFTVWLLRSILVLSPWVDQWFLNVNWSHFLMSLFCRALWSCLWMRRSLIIFFLNCGILLLCSNFFVSWSSYSSWIEIGLFKILFILFFDLLFLFRIITWFFYPIVIFLILIC